MDCLHLDIQRWACRYIKADQLQIFHQSLSSLVTEIQQSTCGSTCCCWCFFTSSWQAHDRIAWLLSRRKQKLCLPSKAFLEDYRHTNWLISLILGWIHLADIQALSRPMLLAKYHQSILVNSIKLTPCQVELTYRAFSSKGSVKRIEYTWIVFLRIPIHQMMKTKILKWLVQPGRLWCKVLWWWINGSSYWKQTTP